MLNDTLGRGLRKPVGLRLTPKPLRQKRCRIDAPFQLADRPPDLNRQADPVQSRQHRVAGWADQAYPQVRVKRLLLKIDRAAATRPHHDRFEQHIPCTCLAIANIEARSEPVELGGILG